MTRPALPLLALALALPSIAASQELGFRPAPDVYFFASPDPLTQSVLRSQLGSRSGGVVSAMLRKAPGSATASARIDIEGQATSADSLRLPAAVIARGNGAIGAEGEQGTALPPKAALTSRFMKRSIAAAQLLSVVEAMRSKAHAQRISKGTP